MTTPTCCGQVCVTPFCPFCGTPLAACPLLSLADRMEAKANAAEAVLDRFLGRYGVASIPAGRVGDAARVRLNVPDHLPLSQRQVRRDLTGPQKSALRKMLDEADLFRTAADFLTRLVPLAATLPPVHEPSSARPGHTRNVDM